MKRLNLITKTTLAFLVLALAAFGIGRYIAVGMISQEVKKETEFSLIESYFQIARSIERGIDPASLENDKISISRLYALNPTDTQFVFADTLAMHPLLKRNEPFRQLKTNRFIAGEYYSISIMDVFMEADDIEEMVMSILTNLFLLLGGIILIFSIVFSRFLFRPFHQTLHRISRFSLQRSEIPSFTESSTSEFSRLNEFLTVMLRKIKKDYITLKEFSENASHEMQTPLAVAKGKLELLIETPNLSAEQVKLLQEAEHSLSKLSRLSEALLLLTKIENREFVATELIDFSEVLTIELESFSELAEMKGLTFKSHVERGVRVKLDEVLTHILISNLLKNAVRHNQDGGWIDVELQHGNLSIRNTGPDPGINPEELFERFKKRSTSKGSLGLGLSIVKKICEACDWGISYTYTESIHEIKIRF